MNWEYRCIVTMTVYIYAIYDRHEKAEEGVSTRDG